MNKIRQLNNDITHTGKAKDYIPGSILKEGRDLYLMVIQENGNSPNPKKIFLNLKTGIMTVEDYVPYKEYQLITEPIVIEKV